MEVAEGKKVKNHGDGRRREPREKSSYIHQAARAQLVGLRDHDMLRFRPSYKFPFCLFLAFHSKKIAAAQSSAFYDVGGIITGWFAWALYALNIVSCYERVKRGVTPDTDPTVDCNWINRTSSSNCWRHPRYLYTGEVFGLNGAGGVDLYSSTLAPFATCDL